MKTVVFLLILHLFYGLQAQSLLSQLEGEKKPEKVSSAWKSIRLGNAQTTKTIPKKHLEYRIMHRFGNLASSDKTINQLSHTWFGLDSPTDIRFALDYGITDNICVGVGRSRINELIDLNGKWKFLEQRDNFSTPISAAIFLSAGYMPVVTSRLYSGIQKDFKTKESHRFNYVTQLIIDSKINKRITIALLPTWTHRNFVANSYHPKTFVSDGNDYFTIGGAARFKIVDRITVFADYFFHLHPFLINHPDFGNPFSIGTEIETGGHIFTLFVANNSALAENNFLIRTTDKWSKTQIKFGFCISRTFSL